jgi:phenylacetate-coenzyme A ligase PaaK-like adenylate-forming protein
MLISIERGLTRPLLQMRSRPRRSQTDPVYDEEDLLDNYPYGMFAVLLRDVVRLQFPLGMYGNPIVIGYTREDLKMWNELWRG